MKTKITFNKFKIVVSEDDLNIGDIAYLRNGMLWPESITSPIKDEKELIALLSLDAKKVISIKYNNES